MSPQFFAIPLDYQIWIPTVRRHYNALMLFSVNKKSSTETGIVTLMFFNRSVLKACTVTMGKVTVSFLSLLLLLSPSLFLSSNGQENPCMLPLPGIFWRLSCSDTFTMFSPHLTPSPQLSHPLLLLSHSSRLQEWHSSPPPSRPPPPHAKTNISQTQTLQLVWIYAQCLAGMLNHLIIM